MQIGLDASFDLDFVFRCNQSFVDGSLSHWGRVVN